MPYSGISDFSDISSVGYDYAPIYEWVINHSPVWVISMTHLFCDSTIMTHNDSLICV